MSGMNEGGWQHVEDCRCLDASLVGGPITTDPRCAAFPGGPRPAPKREPDGMDNETARELADLRRQVNELAERVRDLEVCRDRDDDAERERLEREP
jgi:hypothetical protein